MSSTSAYQAAIAGNNEFELKHATRMAYLTGNDMTDYMSPPNETLNPLVCLECGWSGLIHEAKYRDGENYCPHCNSPELC